MRYPHCRILASRRSRETQPQVQAFRWAVRARSADSIETSMNDNDEIAVTMWRALEKADTPGGRWHCARQARRDLARRLQTARPLREVERIPAHDATGAGSKRQALLRRACRAGRAHRRRRAVPPATW